MVEQRTIMVHKSTNDVFEQVKILFQVKIKKELSDNEFILEMLECITKQEGLKIE